MSKLQSISVININDVGHGITVEFVEELRVSIAKSSEIGKDGNLLILHGD